jgi:N-glycosylase/DNA lyase
MNRFTVSIPRDELDIGLCVSSGQVFRWEKLEDGRMLGVDRDTWFLTDQSETEIKVVTNGAQHRFSSYFRIDESLPQIVKEILKRGPELEPYVNSLPGLRVIKPQNRSEIVFAVLCTPNNNMTRIKKMVGALASYGEPLEVVEGKQLFVFPTIERVAAITEQELREKGFGYRAATIPHVARELLARGEDWLDELAAGPYLEAHSALCEIKGIGPKLADCMCLFALHFTLAAPVDTHLWQAYCRLYKPEWTETALTDAKYRMIGEDLRSRFGDLTGWAHQYLFYDNALNWRSRKHP